MKSKHITVIPGDGIGPSIVKATIKVLDEIGCDFEYEYCDVGITSLEKNKELIPKETLESIEKTRLY